MARTTKSSSAKRSPKKRAVRATSVSAKPRKKTAVKTPAKKRASKKTSLGKKASVTSSKKARSSKALKNEVLSPQINTVVTPVIPPRTFGVKPAAPVFFQEAQGVLPGGYGDHFIYLMICSPYQLYTYWEIQKQRETEALQILGGSWDQVKSILRVYNLSEKSAGSVFFDIELGGDAQSWFIGADPDRSYRVEIGLRHADGRFVMLARSNEVTTPRVGMSDVLDEEWMGIDFEKMYALSGGFEPGSSSIALRRMMEERLRSAISSGSGAGAISSGSVVKKKDRHFWFTLNCELIVYGATMPDAQVTMNGELIKLRPDGTFTLRYALPDGRIRLEAQAVSSDRVESRTITPQVTRMTERPEPVIRRKQKG